MDSTLPALDGSVSRLHDGTYAPAIVITDLTTGKRRRIKLAAHFTEKEKAWNQARERAAVARAYGRMSLPELASWSRECVVCGKLNILLSRPPGHGLEMSIPDEDYWGAALPLPRDADRDAALANLRRRFPDALIEIPGNVAR
jgi:hypothetical protein